MNEFSKLFDTVNIGRVTLKNRIAMAPMGINGFWDPAGSLTQRGIDYYVERARGGVGLIITGVFKVENEIEQDNGRIPRVSPAIVPALAELCEAAHSFGAKIFIQLTAGWGRVARGISSLHPPASASRVPCFWNPQVTTRELTIEEIEKIVHSFGKAAQIVSAAGADGVELHGHEGYLFDQFTTALWNKRTDKYGGNLRRRLTFPIEVLSEIKEKAGVDFPVQYRMGLKHYIKGLQLGALPEETFIEAGQDIAEGLEIARLLEKAGFDSLHVDAGCYDSWYWAHPPVYQEHGCMVDMAARVKKVVRIPVVAVGRLDIPELAAKVIEEDQADIIALGRGLLADPEWPLKVHEGRTSEIRPCIGCHDGCMGRLSSNKRLSCAVNPTCGKERAYTLKAAREKKNIVVVGGGVAGMEAARVTALRGHRVTLYEKKKMLGGHLLEASVPQFKSDLKRLLRWYENQIKSQGIDVKLDSYVSVEQMREEHPDVLFIATGSRPVIPEIPGKNDSKVVTAVDLLLNKKPAGQDVLIVGGGLIGCEIALWLAKQNKTVSIIDALPELMKSGVPIPHMNRLMLLDLLNWLQVKVFTQTKIEKIDQGEIILMEQGCNKHTLKADTVVLSTGLESDNQLYEQLRGDFSRLYALGDCREPRNIMGAIWDAYEIARCI